MARFYEKLKLVEYKCSLSGNSCYAFMYIPKILISIYSEINSCFVLYFAHQGKYTIFSVKMPRRRLTDHSSHFKNRFENIFRECHNQVIKI